MVDESFVIVIDTPSIKKYVFGTDAMNEMRGASALLDQLNRIDMGRHLCKELGEDNVEVVYANGGSAQFLARGHKESKVSAACKSMVKYVRERTGGEVHLVYGIAPLSSGGSYQDAVGVAHFQLRCRREFDTCHRSAVLIPAIKECDSASHLPAAILNPGTDGIEVLSHASFGKDRQGRSTRHLGMWSGWMEYLASAGPWFEREKWATLRCKSVTEIGACSWRDNIGLVYADGNAMGPFVQALTSSDTYRHFSRIVDQSIREACFTALSKVLKPEIDEAREAFYRQSSSRPLPADILLLGGDDLLVALPADRALDFALQVTELFERFTQREIDALEDSRTSQFFRERLCDRGFTISCGVAIAKSNFPFYLQLDLAEQLLKNAKRNDPNTSRSDTSDGARIDFHIVAGANSHTLNHVREESYRVLTESPRTLRPLSCSQLKELRYSVRLLRESSLPRGKLIELQDAALTTRKTQAERRMRDVFARLQHRSGAFQRLALWRALMRLCPTGYVFDFPWFKKDGKRLLCVADIVEAYDLLPTR